MTLNPVDERGMLGIGRHAPTEVADLLRKLAVRFEGRLRFLPGDATDLLRLANLVMRNTPAEAETPPSSTNFPP